jgi:hypothetical protein
MFWKIAQYLVPSPLGALLLLAIPTYAWLALGGSLFYRAV